MATKPKPKKMKPLPRPAKGSKPQMKPLPRPPKGSKPQWKPVSSKKK
jgi:hypothetical protein